MTLKPTQSTSFFDAAFVPPSAMDRFVVCAAPAAAACCALSSGAYAEGLGCRLASAVQAAFGACVASQSSAVSKRSPGQCRPYADALANATAPIAAHLASQYGQIPPGSALCAAFTGPTGNASQHADSYAAGLASSTGCCERMGSAFQPSLAGAPCVILNNTQALADWDACVAKSGAYAVCGDNRTGEDNGSASAAANASASASASQAAPASPSAAQGASADSAAGARRWGAGTLLGALAVSVLALL